MFSSRLTFESCRLKHRCVSSWGLVLGMTSSLELPKQPELLQRVSVSCVCVVKVDFCTFVRTLQANLTLRGDQKDWRPKEG